MRSIKKCNEPASLTEHRAKTHTSYANLSSDAKQELRKSLVSEQQGLCCYCTTRIRANADEMKIEHWKCQSGNQDSELTYGNLLAACQGGVGQQYQDQHCDTRKGDQDLSFNPADPAHVIERRIKFYFADGRIGSDDEQFARELEDFLNLNHSRLKANRKGKLDAFFQWYEQARKPRKPRLEKLLGEITSEDGELEPFSPIVVALVRKKLRITA
ncbi:retron system putative HNH endonuclease [Adhaeretor mobilis]|uniref:TIGR02646 family protein n=1 Tax=Adhaeretor mobilis TaxID=1930276 RepID=A0A517MWQ8_9BACT|nr:retron system putative HNH endonuclease [Adhaeretor mobilis]QDS99312.1 hypothetical protein HG15A2_26340 [Adhaeretor mobilis]